MQSVCEQFAPFPALAALRPDQQELIGSSVRTTGYVKRQRLATQGERAIGCWLIRSGQVGIDLLIPGRGTVMVQTIGPGEIAGWSWLVPPYRWRFGVVALCDVDTIVLDTERLRALCADIPEFGRDLALAMAGTMAQRIEHARSRICQLSSPPVPRIPGEIP